MRTLAVLPLLLAACDPGAGGDEDARVLEFDAADMRMAQEWDAGDMDDQPPVRDAGMDAAPPNCLTQGAALTPSYEGEPEDGLAAVRADLDPDGDGQPDLLLTSRHPDGLLLRLVDGRTLDPIANVAVPGAQQVDWMPGLVAAPDLLVPLSVGGTAAWYGVTRAADQSATLRVFAAADLAQIREIPLAAGLRSLQVVPAGARHFALLNDADGGCAIQPLEHDQPLDAQGNCALRPGWDANGDGVVDILRTGAAGTTLIDGATIEPIAHLDGASVNVGFAPAWVDEARPGGGPIDLRGMGPEVVSVAFENNQLVLRYHDPVDLAPRGDPQVLNGAWRRAEFRMTGEGLRLLAEEDSGGLLYLRVLVPGPGNMVTRRGDFGGFRNLSWGTDVDVDEDGESELLMLGGSDADFLNTDVVFVDLVDAVPRWTVDKDGPARLDGVFARRSGRLVPVDIDGCPGSERLFLRNGRAANDGTRPTRVIVFDDEGGVVHRSEGYSATVHDLALADLDGDGAAEVIEVRGEGSTTTATLRVYAAPGD